MTYVDIAEMSQEELLEHFPALRKAGEMELDTAFVKIGPDPELWHGRIKGAYFYKNFAGDWAWGGTMGERIDADWEDVKKWETELLERDRKNLENREKLVSLMYYQDEQREEAAR